MLVSLFEVGVGAQNYLSLGRAKTPRIARCRGPLPDSETGNQNRELPRFLAIFYTDLPLTLST